MADSYDPPLARFENDVRDHTMKVQLSQGLHRHVDFGKEGSWHMKFSLVTWPGYLAIVGDMESFTFSRTADMFEFFEGASINPSYWAEKIVATAKGSGHRQFSPELYAKALKSDFDGWTFRNKAQKKAAWAAIADDYDGILHATQGEGHDYVRKAMDWKCPVTGNYFVDFWDHNFDDWTYHFIWACRAIRWGIEQFNAAITSPPVGEDTQAEQGEADRLAEVGEG